MSNISIAGDTSGTVTLQAQAVAGSTTLTLPSSTGTVLSDASSGVCRAWVNFNPATGSVTASYNISSVTRNGASDYTVNFANAMQDANYIAVGFDQYQRHCQAPTVTKTTTQHRMSSFSNDSNGVTSDLLQGWFAYFR